MKETTIGAVHEVAIERSDFPPEKVRAILGPETVAVLGYGVQGRGQSLNMRDNGVKVVVGQRKGGKAYDLCLEDGWVPGKTLFDPEEAAAKGTVVQVERSGRKATVSLDSSTRCSGNFSFGFLGSGQVGSRSRFKAVV